MAESRREEEISRLTLCFKAGIREVVWFRLCLADFQLRFLGEISGESE